MRLALILILLSALAASAPAQNAALNGVSSNLSITRQTIPAKPFSVVGPRGAILGQQNGVYEAWIFPWKILSGMLVTAAMQDYAVPINVNDHAAEIDVRPSATTITYSHANFTIRQTMVAPKDASDGASILIRYDVEAIRPMTLTFSFDPVMQRMWPALSDDRPSPEWVKNPNGSGYYILHLNFPDNAAALAMPNAEPGILPPYQERAAYYPLQFVIHVDPATHQNTSFPLLITLGTNAQETTKAAFSQRLTQLNASFAAIFQKNEDYYRNFVNKHLRIETPDSSLNAAFSWAEVAIDQLRVETTPGHKESALTAGFVGSGDAARPGFGWFFGRDALWSLYAVNSYGDFQTTKQEMEFLLQRQMPDGKIIHEWSQTANLVDWKSLPYEGASSDATPLLQMAMADYLKISGDTAFVQANWSSLKRAWDFETTQDNGRDGIYDNGAGSGWVESWVPSMPHQEIYLASLDEQASLAFANLARATGHNDLAEQASARAARIRQTIEKAYYLPKTDFYAFSHNADGTTDDTATIFPSVAWWDGDYKLDHSENMMQRWAASEFSTDWGLRDLSDRTSFYDPISYHQGSVWPLFTGWVSVAEYRAGHPLAGYQHMMQNADLTWSQDLGDVTELLSGRFYQVLGRSTAHQLWSSAMVVSPVVRGMFGLEWNAAKNTLSVNPHLPADWNQAAMRNVPLGSAEVDLMFTRRGTELLVASTGTAHLTSHLTGTKVEKGILHIPLPPVEVAISHGLPEFGAETKQLKIISEQQGPHELKLTLAAPADSTQHLLIRKNEPALTLHADGASLDSAVNGLCPATVTFSGVPSGSKPLYVTNTVTFHW